MDKTSKIYIAGHRGMVGSAIQRLLQKEGYTNILTKTSSELDLRNQDAVHSFFEEHKPDYVFLAAAKVGGIHANNTYRAEFLYDNLAIEMNVIHASHLHKVDKLLFLGSSCIYPKMAKQPMNEDELLTGPLEPTNEPYAIAKIAGIKLCEAYRDQYGSNFISAMPTNLYGPNDNYHPENSHVLPALIRKFYEAQKDQKTSVSIWGSGKPLREFLHVDDLAEACMHLMLTYNEKAFVNIGSGKEVSIGNLAEMIQEVSGFSGKIEYDSSKPDGTPRKLMDNSRIENLGWMPKIALKDGIASVYKEFSESYT